MSTASTSTVTTRETPAKGTYVPPHLRGKRAEAQPSGTPTLPSGASTRSLTPRTGHQPTVGNSRWADIADADNRRNIPPASVHADGASAVYASSPRNVATSATSVDGGNLHTDNPFVKHGEAHMSTGIEFDKYDDIPVEVTAGGPHSLERFVDAGLAPVIMRNVELAGYDKPTPVQKHALPIVSAGRDLMACAQTGSGKTAAFLLPILSAIESDPPVQARRGGAGGRNGGSGFTFGFGGSSGRRGGIVSPRALVLAPTRELVDQIYKEAQKFAYKSAATVGVAYGGTPMGQQLGDLERRQATIIIATPGRLGDLMERGNVSLRDVRHLVLDEADRMLDMGFEPQIRAIVEQSDMPPVGKRLTLLFSATFPDSIQRLARDFLGDYLFLRVGRVGGATESIEQRVMPVEAREKFGALMECLHEIKGLTLVFVGTKRNADDITFRLREREGLPATTIHGDLEQRDREYALNEFRTGARPILIATDVAARGLDIPNVLHVINYDLPNNIDDYVHRIGRTGRAGNTGLATAFVCDRDSPTIIAGMCKVLTDAHQDVPQWLSARGQRGGGGSSGYGGRRGGGGNSRFGGSDFRSAGRASAPSSSAGSAASAYGHFDRFQQRRDEGHSGSGSPSATHSAWDD